MSDTPTWAELLPPPSSVPVEILRDAYWSRRWFALMSDGFYVSDNYLGTAAAMWTKVDAADVPSAVKQRMADDLTSGVSFYDDIDP